MLWAKSPTEETFCSLFPMTPWYQGHTTMEENMALGSFISCKAIFVHAGAIVNYKCNESGFVCFFVERKKRLIGHEEKWVSKETWGRERDMIELYEKQLKSIKNVKHLYQ